MFTNTNPAFIARGINVEPFKLGLVETRYPTEKKKFGEGSREIYRRKFFQLRCNLSCPLWNEFIKQRSIGLS